MADRRSRRELWISLAALAVAVVALALNGVDVHRRLFYSPYRLSAAVLQCHLAAASTSRDRVEARLAFSNTGVQDVLISGVSLRFRAGQYSSTSVRCGREDAVPSLPLSLAAGEKAVGEYFFDCGALLAAAPLGLQAEGYDVARAWIDVSLISPSGEEVLLCLPRISIVSEDGCIVRLVHESDPVDFDYVKWLEFLEWSQSQWPV